MPSGLVATASWNWVTILLRVPVGPLIGHRRARMPPRPPWLRCRTTVSNPPPAVPPGKKVIFMSLQNWASGGAGPCRWRWAARAGARGDDQRGGEIIAAGTHRYHGACPGPLEVRSIASPPSCSCESIHGGPAAPARAGLPTRRGRRPFPQIVRAIVCSQWYAVNYVWSPNHRSRRPSECQPGDDSSRSDDLGERARIQPPRSRT